MIYDKTHREFLVHRAKRQWAIVAGAELAREAAENISQDEVEYEKLWKGFFQSVSIKERENPKCQRSNLPLRWRREMTEFS